MKLVMYDFGFFTIVLFYMYGNLIVFYITVQTPTRRNPRSTPKWTPILMKTSSRTTKTIEDGPGV